MKQTNSKLQTETFETHRLQLVHYNRRICPDKNFLFNMKCSVSSSQPSFT